MAASAISNSPNRMSRFHFVGCVFLPYAVAYFLSYVFRSINAVIGADLAAEFHLSATDLGLLTAVYFLAFAVAQIPLGILLDRHESGLVQSVLMLFASVGALIFAEANCFSALVIGRGLIGLGLAATLIAGLKTIVVWVQPERISLVTGMMVMSGALGALATTGPADAIALCVGWRGLFVILAVLTALGALAVLFAAPEAAVRAAPRQAVLNMSAVYRDRRFWRIAPLCALGVGSSWSLQSLWAAPWMRDVEGFDQTHIVHHLSIMAFAVCVGAPLFGLLSVRLRGFGVTTEDLLVGTLSLSALAQIALVLRLPLPPTLLWIIISAAGATTVLSYSLINGYFPKSGSSRGHGALNLLNIGAALMLQSATGVILSQWPNRGGVYALAAYQTGFAVPLILQLSALAWFLARRGRRLSSMQWSVSRPLRSTDLRYRSRLDFAPASAFLSKGHNSRIREHVAGWPFAALASTVLSITLATIVISGQGFSSLDVFNWSPWHPRRVAGSDLGSVALPQIVGNTAATTMAGLGR